MTSVSLKGIGKRYPNGYQAVHQLDLEVQPGELIALVGPSGCGKSTTLRMIAGLEEITSGELYIDGIRANDLPPKDRGIGMVFQSYALYPHMTARQNITFGLKLQRLPEQEIEDRVNEVAQQLKISDLLDRKPKQMSGGQRQRVAMARAIARRPDIFLFDEPLSNLDAQLRAEMRVEISRLQRELKATSFYVTHDQVEAMTLADRVVLLKDGRLQQIGAPIELYRSPANRFVATFIGSPTMNMMMGERTSSGMMISGTDLHLSEARQRTLTQKEVTLGETLELGIRPHEIGLSVTQREAEHSPSVLRGEIEVIEPLGSETLCYVRLSGETDTHQLPLVIVRVESTVPVQRGDWVDLALNEDAIHLFRADEEGERL